MTLNKKKHKLKYFSKRTYICFRHMFGKNNKFKEQKTALTENYKIAYIL